MKLYWSRTAKEGLVTGEQPFPLPTKAPRHVPRFFVPAGTPCAVSKVSPLDWRTYTTRRGLGFERFERYERCDTGGFYQFRSDVGGWLLLVHRQYVQHRADRKHEKCLGLTLPLG
jgi:hypothetical protein